MPPSALPPASTEVFFIVDGLRLEAQACLLAPTLAAHLDTSQRPVAYLRQDAAPLTGFTRAVLEASGVALRTIPGTASAPAPWGAPYPQGNKILAAAAPRECAVSVFLDTDTVLAEPVDFAAELGTAEVAAVVSDYRASAGDEADWAEYYGAFGLDLPPERVRLLGGRSLLSLPYYNAGVVIFRERAPDGRPTGFGPAWLEAALQFERQVRRPHDRANIDQFTLPILGYLRASPVRALPRRMNYNIQADGTDRGQAQSIAHYHNIGLLWAHPRHGRMAFEALVGLMGPGAPRAFVESFGEIARRRRMKRLLGDAA